jgi:hypothetical protein
VSAHEVVLPEEVPRLRRAAVVLGVALLPVLLGGLVVTPSVAVEVLVGHLLLVGLAAGGALGVLARPGRPAFRRLAFLAALPVTSLLLVTLLLVTFAVGSAEVGGYALYVMLVLVTAGTVWSVSVFWPTVQLDSGTSSGNRPHRLSGSTSSTPSS